jgi:hypothetical protein
MVIVYPSTAIPSCRRTRSGLHADLAILLLFEDLNYTSSGRMQVLTECGKSKG